MNAITIVKTLHLCPIYLFITSVTVLLFFSRFRICISSLLLEVMDSLPEVFKPVRIYCSPN